MRQGVFRPVAALLLAAGLSPVAAAEYRSVAVPAAILYDGPSLQAKKRFVAPRGMPVEVLAAPDAFWVKARDVSGDQFWVARRDLGSARSVIAAVPATLRQSPSESAPVLLQVERGVLLEPLGPVSGGWLPVKHRDGVTGHVRATEVWGG